MQRRRMGWLAAVALAAASAPFPMRALATIHVPSSETSTTAAQIGILEGSITALNLDAALLSLQVSKAEGGLRIFRIDSSETAIYRNGRPVTPQELEIGQSVLVRHTQRNGIEVAQSIEIVPLLDTWLSAKRGEPAPQERVRMVQEA